jgi:hypothetical protein
MTRHKAQSLVEFAFVFPIFLMLTLALLDFGRAAWQYNTLADIARQAARQRELGVMSPGLQFCKDLSLKSCVFTTTVPPPTPPADTVQVALAPCNPGPPPGPPTVTASYTFQPVIGFLGNFPWVGSATSSTPSVPLAATATVPLVPGVCS